MNLEEQGDKRGGPMILFPEILGLAVMAIAAPIYLIKILVSGQALVGIAGLVIWFTALLITARLIWRRQYFFAYLIMLAIFGLYYIIQKRLWQ